MTPTYMIIYLVQDLEGLSGYRILVYPTYHTTGSLNDKCMHWKKNNWSHFDLKSRVTGGTKIRPEIPGNWRIFESNWVDIESQIVNLTCLLWSLWLVLWFVLFDSILRVKLLIWLSIWSQFDSNILQLLGISDRILVPPMTQLFRSK